MFDGLGSLSGQRPLIALFPTDTLQVLCYYAVKSQNWHSSVVRRLANNNNCNKMNQSYRVQSVVVRQIRRR